MFYWRVDVLCRVYRLRSSCLPLVWLLRSYWDNKVESGHYSSTHMVSISPCRPCHCTGLLLHALLANCWKKKKKCSGERTKIYCTMHFGSFDLTLKFKPPARTQVEFDLGWNQGKAKDGLALVSCSIQTFTRRLFILSQLLRRLHEQTPGLGCSFCRKESWRQMRLDEGDRLWQLLFLVRFRHRRLGNSVAGGRKVDLEQSRKQTAEGWGRMQLSLSAVDQQKTPQTDSVCHACVSASLCHPLLAIVSQRLLLKEVFLYWSVNKLSIVPTSTAKFRWAQLPYLCLHSSRNCPIFVFDFRCQSLEWRSSVRAAECELPHRTISHYSWRGCIMLDWFRCFCLSPGSDILCSLCCWL